MNYQGNLLFLFNQKGRKSVKQPKTKIMYKAKIVVTDEKGNKIAEKEIQLEVSASGKNLPMSKDKAGNRFFDPTNGQVTPGNWFHKLEAKKIDIKVYAGEEAGKVLRIQNLVILKGNKDMLDYQPTGVVSSKMTEVSF